MPDAFARPPRPEASVPVAYAFELKEPQPVATGWGHFMLRERLSETLEHLAVIVLKAVVRTHEVHDRLYKISHQGSFTNRIAVSKTRERVASLATIGGNAALPP